MAVYVDRERNPFHGMVMCHMLADTLEELHAMAAKLGMRRGWFQPKSTPHYDLCEKRRALAVALGAIEVNRTELVAIVRRLRSAREQSNADFQSAYL